jgi:hypothetical protein
MSAHAQCYGQMFPPNNAVPRGRVFGWQVERPGAVIVTRTATVDAGAWERCLRCPELDACYRLSTGKVLMSLAAAGQP